MTTPTSRPAGLSRRSFLRSAVGVAAMSAIGVPTLAACSSGGAAGGTARASSLTLPTYVAFAGPKPDLPGTADGVPPGYRVYPKDLVTTVEKPPLSGGKVSVMTNIFDPLPPSKDKNSAWQEVERKLGGSLDLTIVPASDWETKFQTVLAANELPDLTLLADPAAVNNLPAFLAAKCADLTPYLSGDKVKEYPNLANVPAIVWQACVVDDKLYGLPIPRSITGGSGFYNQRHLDEAGVGYPTSAEEFLAACKALTKPQQGRWAIVNSKGNTFFTMIQHMFGVPNGWRSDGGKLVRSFETEQYKAALEFAVQLVKAGVVVPGSDGIDSQARKNAFKAGKGAFVYDGFPAYPDYVKDMHRLDAKNDPRAFVPIAPAGGKAVTWSDNILFAYTLMKKADEARVKELLGVANFFAAPFGSTENLLLSYGVEGVDFTRDANGNPKQNAKGEAELTVPWKYIAGPPQTLFNADDPTYVDKAHADLGKLIALVVEDPTANLISPTDDKSGGDLGQALTDVRNDVIAGRKPMTAFDAAVKKWAKDGGDKIRGEFEQALGGASPR
ncbi:carbohydrate ABC transporter substrate-binding protein (CUT1 family) [Kribbella amoyensis]|uniref:Carbohydrate ABC transporter substrate-binding protein (CUT1 family) n=1 Tax=Kribbella amoyensis TaxID=996641 RepID=A0A561BVL1_9ACTN|nr:extracellular solute-binding protein [Kribbella amoyensis]TWD82898.1 carbohydrate ABC transporter substrate-binding protein (CUT1 family) [Kribbella amoyensis]